MVRRINLIPAGDRRRTQADTGLLIAVVVAMLAVGAMGATYFRTSGQLADYQAELAELQTQNAQVQAQLTSLASYGTLEQQRQQAQAVAQHVYEHRTLISEVLGDISLVVPENVWFANLTVKAPTIPTASTETTPTAAPGAAPVVAQTPGAPGAPPAAGNLSIDATTYSFEDVSRLLVRLQQVPSLKDVALSTAGAEGDTDNKSTTVQASVINARPLSSPLPIALVEVEGQ